MKTIYKLLTLALVLCISACEKEAIPEKSESVVDKENATQVVSEDKTAVETYYSTMGSLVSEFLTYSDKTGSNSVYNTPFFETGSLSSMDIRDANGKRIFFSMMPLDEQIDFVSSLCVELADIKIKQLSKVQGKDIDDEYEIFSVLAEDIRYCAEDLMDDGEALDDIIDIIIDGFSISKRLMKFTSSYFNLADFGPGNGSCFKDFNHYKKALNDAGIKRGDLCVILPIFGSTALYNLTPDYLVDEEGDMDYHSLGHCATFIMSNDKITQETDKALWAAVEDGVMDEDLSQWQCDQYLLRLHDLKFIWNRKDEDNPLTIEENPFTEKQLNCYINKLKSYEGKDEHNNFVGDHWINWFFAKTLAPNEFTCASLIWHCAKSTLGIDLSIPFLPTIAPLNVVTSPYTEILSCVKADEVELDD